MSQRSVSDAKALLEEQGHTLAASQRKEVEGEIREAEGHAIKRAEAGMTERYNFAIAQGQAIGQELCQLRDNARTLAADLRAGRLTAAEGTKAWNDLRRQARSLAAANAKQNQHADFLATVEADPVRFVESVDAKYPALLERTQTNFSI